MDTNLYTGPSYAGQSYVGAPHLAVPVSGHDHCIGNADARVTLVQYGDYECASCLDAEPIVRRLLERHGRAMRFVYRHFPRSWTNPEASLAAQAAEAAGAQGKFWEMHDLLIRNRGIRDEAELTHLALTVGLEIYRFSAELARSEHENRVRADFIGGVQSGVNETPTFFVDRVQIARGGDVDDLFDAVQAAIDRAGAWREAV